MGIETAIAAATAIPGIVGMFGGGGGSKAKQVGGVPPDIAKLRTSLTSWLMSGAPGISGAQGGSGYGGIFSPGLEGLDTTWMNHVLQPYQDLFAASRRRTLAQAKESAGNLTGSGFNNILGSSAEQSMAQEQATLGQLLMQGAGMELQNKQQNARNILSMLMGMSTAGVGPGEVVSQPGWLDYLGQGLSALGPALGKAWGGGGTPMPTSSGPSVVPINTGGLGPTSPGPFMGGVPTSGLPWFGMWG